MNRLLPRTLFGQTLAILVVGLALSQAIGAWFYAADREEAVRAVGGMAAAQRIANLAQLIDESAPETRPRIAQALTEPTFRVGLAATPPAAASPTPASQPAQVIAGYLADSLDLPPDAVRVALSLDPLSPEQAEDLARRHGPYGRMGQGGGMGQGMGQGMGVGRGMGYGRMMRLANLRELSAAIRLSDGQWVTFTAGLADQAPARPWWLYGSLAVMALTVLGASAWAVWRTVAPFRLLGRAAERLGRDVAAEPLAEQGPAEVRTAIRAFNRMQENLRRLIEGRGRLLAALSHDLRTPLTLLRLRLEGLDGGDERERLLATVGGMEEMVGTTLDFARQTTLTAPRRPTDLAALLASLADDMADAGLPVSLVPSPPVVCEVQVTALRRAVTNLVDNALKFGGRAELSLTLGDGQVRIAVQDDGPGIPEAELDRVFEPFYRGDPSRNADSGGSGLGLSIAQSVAQAHGGQVVLANRPDGGLLAEIVLPVPG